MNKLERVCVYTVEDGTTTTGRYGYQTKDGIMFFGENGEQEANEHQQRLNRTNRRNKIEKFLTNLVRRFC